MSAAELRKQFLALQKEFMGGSPAGKMKRHELEHRMAVLKHAMSVKAETPEPEPARSGPPAAREVKTKKVAIDAETEVTKPIAPSEGKAHVTHYKKKPKAEVTEAAPVAEKPEKPKKVRKVPPKVELPDEPVAPKPRAAPKPKSKATAEPKTDLPPPEPETPPPAPAAPVKLPGGCRRMPDAELYIN
jgi:hypothetical protein